MMQARNKYKINAGFRREGRGRPGVMRMRREHRISAIIWTLVSCTAIMSSGCRSTGGAGVPLIDRPVGEPSSIDPKKAHLALERIEPGPQKPTRLENLKPLSARAQKQIVKADELVSDQRYTEAAIELERALRYDPNHPEIHRALAVLHWEARNLERAKTHVAHALEGNTDAAAVHYIQGRCRASDGHHASAMTSFRTALLCSDVAGAPETLALIHYHLAQSLASEGYLQAALDQYDAYQRTMDGFSEPPGRVELALLAANGHRPVRLARADLLERLGRFEQAAKVLSSVVARAPGDVPLGIRHVRLLERAGRYEEALGALRTVPSTDDSVMELLFEIHDKAGHPERALDDVRSSLASDPDNASLVSHLASLLQRLERRDEARRTLEEFLDRHADAPTIRHRLLDSYVQAKEWNLALRCCADAILLAPDRSDAFVAKITSLVDDAGATETLLHGDRSADSAEALYLRGALALAAEDVTLAEQYLKQVLAMKKDLIPARVALARTYIRAYRYDDAIEVAGRQDQDVPEHARLEFVLGDIHERLDDIEKAEFHYKTAVQLNRTYEQAMFALVKLYDRSQRRLQAQRQLGVLIEAYPDNDKAREMLAYTYFQEGKPDVAMVQFEELRLRTKLPLLAARCAALLEQMRGPDPEKYRSALRKAMDEHGADAITWIALAESFAGDSHPQERHNAYLEALKLDADREDVLIGLVSSSQQLLEFEHAAELLQSLLPRRPNRHSWRLSLIEMMWTLQEYDKALSLANEALDRDGLDVRWQGRYRLAVMETLRQADRNDELLAQVKHWAESETEGDEWQRRLARTYERLEKPIEAVAIYQRLVESDPVNRDLLRALVAALVAAQRYDRASQYMLDWLNDDPENEDALFRLVGVLAGAKRFDDALELIRNRLLRTFARESYQDVMVGVLAQAERFEDALDFVESLIDEVHSLIRGQGRAAENQLPEFDREELIRRPNDPLTMDGLHNRLVSLRTSLVRILIASKDYKGAEEELSAWLDASRNPAERFEYLRLLAFAYHMLQDEEKAGTALARMVLLRPGDPTINNDVAYGWIDRGVRLDEAEVMIRHSLSKAPRQTAYLDTYGWLKYKQGDFAEAEKWLSRAARQRGNPDPVILDHLGDTLWRLGRPESAAQRWTAAVEASKKRDDEALTSADELRVRETTPSKIEAAGADRRPAIAPIASEQVEAKGDTDDSKE